MRYFETVNASRPYKAGGLIFTFLATELVMGAWRGVLEVSDSDGGVLASEDIPQIKEIPYEEYLDKKKEVRPKGSFVSPKALEKAQSHNLGAPPAAPKADLESELSAFDATIPAVVATTDAVPPDEPLLVSAPSKSSKRK